MEIHDILGIEPIGEAALQVTQATIDGVSSFLNIVCKPGLEELGFLFRDKVRNWRLKNILRMLDKARGRMNFDGHELNLCVNPRVGLTIMECCSDIDNNDLQELWAGLFVSSGSSDGQDDSNMNFVDLLRRMSSVEAKILAYGCENCEKLLCPNQLIVANSLVVSLEELKEITGTNDIYRLDSELDHMRSIELLVSGRLFGGGFYAVDELDANITPSPLALNLYYRTHSMGVTPIEFWGDRLVAAPLVPADSDDSTE